MQYQESLLSGTVQSISFVNQHMHLQLCKDQCNWEVECAPPIVAQSSGIGPRPTKAGDRETSTGHRAGEAGTLVFKGETITVNGMTYNVYPKHEKTIML